VNEAVAGFVTLLALIHPTLADVARLFSTLVQAVQATNAMA
jgi:hypothetical protein